MNRESKLPPYFKYNLRICELDGKAQGSADYQGIEDERLWKKAQFTKDDR